MKERATRLREHRPVEKEFVVGGRTLVWQWGKTERNGAHMLTRQCTQHPRLQSVMCNANNGSVQL